MAIVWMHLSVFGIVLAAMAGGRMLTSLLNRGVRERGMRPLMLGFAAVAAMGAGACAGDRWAGFQGPVPDDVRAASLPLEWSPEKQLAWSAELPGYGQSSPVVWDGVVYATSVTGKMKEAFQVSAWNLKTGAKKWQHDVAAASQVENSNYTSRAAPTPVVDEKGLVVFLESGNLLALDHDGEVVWSRNLVAEFGAVGSRHGLSSSLVADGGRVFVWVEREKDPYVLGIDRETGKDAWKQAGLGGTSWSTPTILQVGESRHLVLSGSGFLVGLDPKTGERLWTLEGLGGNTVARPQSIGDGRLLVGASAGRGGEAAAGAPSNGVVEVTKGDDGWKAAFVWRAEDATSSFGSPIVHRGLAYFVNRTGVLFCLDATSGEEKYAERLPESVWATPLAVEDRIYFVGKGGTTAVVKAGEQFEVLAENRTWAAGPGAARPGDFSGPVQYAVVALPGRLLIRRGDVLYCFSGTDGAKKSED